MQIVGGGELYCEIFSSSFLFFSKCFNFLKKKYLCLIIFILILDALLNPYLKTAPRQFFKGVPHDWLSYSII